MSEPSEKVIIDKQVYLTLKKTSDFHKANCIKPITLKTLTFIMTPLPKKEEVQINHSNQIVMVTVLMKVGITTLGM